MLFHITHTHRQEACPAVYPDRMEMLRHWWTQVNKTPGVNIISCVISPLDHTFYITAEADDFPTFTRALGPLNEIGSGQTVPVLPIETLLQIAEEGAFHSHLHPTPPQAP